MNAARRTHTDTPVLLGRTWLFPDGTRLPVIAGAADDTDVVIPEDLTTASADDLAALEAQLVAAFDAHLDEGSTDVAAMTQIAEALDRVRGEQQARTDAEAAAAEQIAALRTRVHAEAADPEEPPAEEDAPAEDAPAAPTEDKVSVTASAVAPMVVRVPASASGTSRRAPRPTVPTAQERTFITAAADLPGVGAGERIDTLQVAKSMHDKARGLSDGSARVPIATVNIPYADDQIVRKSMSAEAAMEVIDRAANPERLSLVAAGGWCAPSQIMFDVFALDGVSGLLDVPSVGIERGGMQVPSYIGIDAANGGLWTWSEAQDSLTALIITDLDATAGVATVTTSVPHLLSVGDTVNILTGTAADGPRIVATVGSTTTFTFATTGTPTITNAVGSATRQKGVFRIPCPTWTDYRLQAYGLTIEHGNLTDRAFPELTRRYVSLVMSAHLRRVSAAHVATMAAAGNADAVSVTSAPSDSYGELMSAIELQAEDYRSQYLMSRNTVLEVVLPSWTNANLRANLAMRSGVDLLAVTDAQLLSHFAARNVRVQFVEQYRPLYSGAPKTAWPTSTEFIMNPAGSIVEGTGGSIDLGVVRDSRLNATNDFTAAWSEDFRVLMRRGPKGRKVTVVLDTNGITG